MPIFPFFSPFSPSPLLSSLPYNSPWLTAAISASIIVTCQLNLDNTSVCPCLGTVLNENHQLKNPVDLASSALGSSIVAVTDEFFAPAINLINPAPPIHCPGKFVGEFLII